MPIENPEIEKVIHRLALSESGFVFDPVSGQSFTVNESGLDILRQLQKNTDLQQTHEYLMQNYAASEQELQRDLEDFMAALKEQTGLQ